MARKTVLIDDYDGSELSSDTTPLRLSLGRKAYRLYLSDKSLEALYSALEPFTKDAETESGLQATASTAKTDKARTKAIREWAQSQNITHNGKPLGDRGRIPEEIVEQYDANH